MVSIWEIMSKKLFEKLAGGMKVPADLIDFPKKGGRTGDWVVASSLVEGQGCNRARIGRTTTGTEPVACRDRHRSVKIGVRIL
jgi:hypothetical protein